MKPAILSEDLVSLPSFSIKACTSSRVYASTPSVGQLNNEASRWKTLRGASVFPLQSSKWLI